MKIMKNIKSISNNRYKKVTKLLEKANLDKNKEKL